VGSCHKWPALPAAPRQCADGSSTYLEFDLETILEGGHYNEFVLFYRLCHRTRLPQAGRPAEDCWLEKYYQLSVEKGGRVRDNLRDGVEEALKVLGTGFLRHPENTALLEKIDSGKLSADQYHRQLLLLVYRLLFLTVAEDRHLVISIGESAARNQAIYQDNYSIGKLRERAEGLLEDSGFGDLWVGLTQTFKLFADSNDTNPLGIPPLNGDLFSLTTIPDLETAQLSNLDLLKAIRWLMFYRERNVRQRVNYAALDVEELGSVYESLLDFRPVISKESDGRKFELGVGGERKTTGSYYTRPELVRELIQSALVPVLEDRLAEAEKQTKGQPAEAIRIAKVRVIQGISVCDPACGSGHFLLEAARRLGKELARIRVGEDEPTPEQFHVAVRDVISHCIYGVDRNPLAVDLCKLALWLEGHWAGKPLSFLDHRIRCGNSLIGVLDPAGMADGIPDDAFNPVTGDDKKIAAAYKKRNKAEKVGQKRLDFEQEPAEHIGEYAQLFGIRLDFPEDKPSDVRRKAELFEKARGGADWWHDWTASNLWTASFSLPLKKPDDPEIPTQEKFLSYLLHRKDQPQMTGMANALANKLRFFHWRLEFPEVFERGGFDVVLGNPPWERPEFHELDHWVDVPYIGAVKNKAERAKRISEYRDSGDVIKRRRFDIFEDACHSSECESKFWRGSGRFPLTAAGKFNLFALFAELDRNLLSENGRLGIIVPSGVATDATCQPLFADMVRNHAVASLFDFENREKVFAAVDSRMKFCLLTVSARPQARTRFAFFLTRSEHLTLPHRQFYLTAQDFAVFNPNTQTCPIFRTQVDAALTNKFYSRCDILVRDHPPKNPWGVQLLRVFNMGFSEIIGQARTAKELGENGCKEKSGRRFTCDSELYLPVTESKTIHQYNHRFATYEGCSETDLENGQPRASMGDELMSPSFMSSPRYWLPVSAFPESMRFLVKHEWLLGYRNFARATDDRTFIAAFLPFAATDFPLRIMLVDADVKDVCLLMANLNSLVFDFVVRQKVGGTDLSSFIVKQFPVLGPGDYRSQDRDFIRQRVLELVYTAADMKPFADKVGHTGTPFTWNEERRGKLRAEVDAYYAHLYGLTCDELRYVLDPQDVFGEDFPSETFRVLKDKEEKEYGEYRTRRLVLAAYDGLAKSDRFIGEKRESVIEAQKDRSMVPIENRN
jgi:hypothetical protein